MARRSGWRTFCACCSITPQLTTGARNPMPMKLSAVSPRIMPGTARVTLVIRKLVKPGSRWRLMIDRARPPAIDAAIT